MIHTLSCNNGNLQVFSPHRLRSGSVWICQCNILKDRPFLTKEWRCTQAEIKAIGAPLFATPTNLGPGTVTWVICRFLQHTTSLTESAAEGLLQMLSINHTGAWSLPASALFCFLYGDLWKRFLTRMPRWHQSSTETTSWCVVWQKDSLLECSSWHVSVWIVHLGVVVKENGGVFYVDEVNQEGEDIAWCQY